LRSSFFARKRFAAYVHRGDLVAVASADSSTFRRCAIRRRPTTLDRRAARQTRRLARSSSRNAVNHPLSPVYRPLSFLYPTFASTFHIRNYRTGLLPRKNRIRNPCRFRSGLSSVHAFDRRIPTSHRLDNDRDFCIVRTSYNVGLIRQQTN
jgi:hypothetical protein